MSNPTEKSIHIAAQCWCDKETSHIVMNIKLATAFAKRLDTKEDEINTLKSQIETLEKTLLNHHRILQINHSRKFEKK